MVNGINASGGNFAQMQGMQQRKGQGMRFNQFDADKSGTIDQTELQGMTDKISEMTGQKLSVEDVTKAYDANNDGLMAMSEMQSMMMELRGTTGSPSESQGSMQSLLANYQTDPDNDLTSLLMDMGADSEDEKKGYSAVNLKA
ncbi:MAG: EF-hand domain-containing protein [Desulfocapsa sp.]|nr:EF-hand domain-containing protein [Desulfocapsa sp.]